MISDKEIIDCLKRQVRLYRYDYLTGFRQRYDFMSDIVENFNVGSKFYLIHYDVNNLHNTNRANGYSAGDTLIKKVAHDISKKFKSANIYRISGDEFYVISKEKPTKDIKIEDATGVYLCSANFSNSDVLLEEIDKMMIVEKKHLKRREQD